MAEDDDVRADLLARIERRRAGVQAFLRERRPRVRRLATASIVLSSIAALSTAGPAVGGEAFAGGLQRTLGLASDSYVWRVLCFIALLVSVSSAIAINLAKSPEPTTQLATAEAADGELEGLSLLLEFGDLAVADAVKLYQQYTAKIGFIDEPAFAGVGAAAPSAAAGRSSAAPAPARAERRTRVLPAVPPPVHHRHGSPDHPPHS
jgi:hypothetical protein